MTQKLGARLRSRGPGEVIGLARDRLKSFISSQDVLILYARPTSSQPPGIEPPGLKLRVATSEDGARYAQYIGTDSPHSFRSRLSARTRCFVVARDDEIVHSSWVTTAAAWTRELRAYFRPPPGDAYVYESFTRPELRGRGVYPFALQGIAERLAREDVARVWVGVEAGNTPSIKAVSKAGFEPGFEISYARRLGRLVVGRPKGPLADLCRGCFQRKESSP